MRTLGGKVTNRACNNAENDTGPRCDVTRCRCGSDETRDASGTPTDHRPLSSQPPIEKNPSDCSEHGRKVGVPASHGGTQVCAECRTTVESQPSKPEEYGAERDQGHVVGSEVQHHLLLTPTKHHRICQSGQSGSNLDGSTSGVVHHTPAIAPTIGIPCPASDRTVDESRPAEDEDHGGD